MRITLITDPDLVNSNYRAYQPMHILSARGHEIRHNHSNQRRFELKTLLSSDAILIHRYCDREIQQAAERARQAGVGVVWDNDDDVTAVPRANPLEVYKGLNRHRIASGLAAMLRTVDVVTTPSQTLAEKFRAGGAQNVRILENYVRDDFVRDSSRRRGDALTIGWLAGLEHRTDLEQLGLRSVLARLLEERPQVSLVSAGVNLGLDSPRYRHVRQVEFLEIPRFMADLDIGIAPLADTPFNSARSNVKLKEYAAAGTPWLASPAGPYLGHGEHEGGRLVADDRWHETLLHLIDHPRELRKLAKRASRWGRAQTIGSHAELWERTLQEAQAHARAQRADAP